MPCAIIYRLKKYRGVEQLVARRAHNPEVVGSNPSPATKSVTVVDTISTTVIFCLLPFLECFWHETGDIPNISGHKQIVSPDLMRSWSEKTGLGKMTIVIIIETINYYFLYIQNRPWLGVTSDMDGFLMIPMGQKGQKGQPKFGQITNL